MTPNLTRFWSTGCLECFWSLVYLWRCCNLSMGSAYHTEGLWADTKFGTGFGTETPRLQGRVQEVMRGRYGITIREDVTMAPWNTTRNADLKQVIISSPFLRCLQTAMVLAEHFDAETWLANNTRQRSLVEATISKEELDFKEHIYFNNLQYYIYRILNSVSMTSGIHFWPFLSSRLVEIHQDVLVDNELGEAMTTEVFESEPPLPPRPWTKVRGTKKKKNNTLRKSKQWLFYMCVCLL